MAALRWICTLVIVCDVSIHQSEGSSHPIKKLKLRLAPLDSASSSDDQELHYASVQNSKRSAVPAFMDPRSISPFESLPPRNSSHSDRAVRIAMDQRREAQRDLSVLNEQLRCLQAQQTRNSMHKPNVSQGWMYRGISPRMRYLEQKMSITLKERDDVLNHLREFDEQLHHNEGDVV